MGDGKPLSTSESFDGSAPVVPVGIGGRGVNNDVKSFQSSEKLNSVSVQIAMHMNFINIIIHVNKYMKMFRLRKRIVHPQNLV